MTVELDKKQIHLGWETAVGIMLFTIATVWGGGLFTAKYLAKQDAIYGAVIRLSKKDSMQDVRLDSIAGWHIKGVTERMNMRAELDYLMTTKAQVVNTRYYTERKINGRLVFLPAKKDKS